MLIVPSQLDVLTNEVSLALFISIINIKNHKKTSVNLHFHCLQQQQKQTMKIRKLRDL